LAHEQKSLVSPDFFHNEHINWLKQNCKKILLWEKEHDIAIVQPDVPFQATNYVQLIELAKGSFKPQGDKQFDFQ